MSVSGRHKRVDRGGHRHRRSCIATVVLTALSVVPDFLIGVESSAVAVLVLTHVAAAVIVIPTLASRLDR